MLIFRKGNGLFFMGEAKRRKALGLPPRTDIPRGVSQLNTTLITRQMVESNDPFLFSCPEAVFLFAVFELVRKERPHGWDVPDYVDGSFLYPNRTGDGWRTQFRTSPKSALVKCAWDVDTPNERFISFRNTFADGTWTPVSTEPVELPTVPWDSFASKDSTGRIVRT